MDWEDDPGVTEETVRTVKDARAKADAFHEQSKLDEWMKEALREVLGNRQVPANPYHALAEHFRTIEIRAEMERNHSREGALLQTLTNELSLPDETTGLARLRSGGPWCARPHVLRGVHAPSLEGLVDTLRKGPRFLLKHFEEAVEMEDCKIRTVSALMNGSAFVGRLVPRLQELEVSHVFLVHGPKPEKALNASGRLLLQALLDSTADTRVVDATLTLEASGRTAAQHWRMDSIASEGAHGRFIRDVKGAMVGRRAVTLRCWCWLRLPFHAQPQFTPLRLRFALIFSPSSAVTSFKVLEPRPGELLTLGVFLDARRAATYASATAAATVTAAADEGRSSPEEEAHIALSLQVARGLRRGHVDVVHAGIAALVLMERGEEGALAGVHALTHSTASEVAGVVAAACSLADVLAALRKGPLDRMRAVQEEQLRPSWVAAKAVAAEATRPRATYGQRRVVPAQGEAVAVATGDAADDRIRVINSLLQQQFRLVLVRTMTIAKTARSSHVVSAWPALQRALLGLRDPVTGALLINARAPRAARVVEAILQNSARLAFRDAMDAALTRYESLARVLRGVRHELGSLLDHPSLAMPLATLAAPRTRGRRQGSRIGGDRPRSSVHTPGSGRAGGAAQGGGTPAQAAEAAAAALRAIGENGQGSKDGGARREQSAAELQSAPPRLVVVGPMAVEAAMGVVSELLARAPATVFAGGDNGEGAHEAVEVATEARRAVAMGEVPAPVAREGAVARTAVRVGLHACLAECASAALWGRRPVRPLPRVVDTLYRWGALLERSRRMTPARVRRLRAERGVEKVSAAPWVWHAVAGSGAGRVEEGVYGTRSAVSHCAIHSARAWLDHLEASGDVRSLPAEARASAELQVSSFLLGEAAFHGSLTQPRGCSAHSVLAYHEHAVRAATQEAALRAAARAVVHRARRLVASPHHGSVAIVAGHNLGVTPSGWGGVPDAMALYLGALSASREDGGGGRGARAQAGGFNCVLETGTAALVAGMGAEGMLETPGPVAQAKASPSLRFLDHAALIGAEAARRRQEQEEQEEEQEEGREGGAGGGPEPAVHLRGHRWAAHSWDPLAPPLLGSSDDAPRPLRREWFHDRRAQSQSQARTYAACARGDLLGGLGRWEIYDEVRLTRDETGVATEVERALRTGLTVAVFSLAKPPPPPAPADSNSTHSTGAGAAAASDGPLASLHPLVPVLEVCGAAHVSMRGQLHSSHSGALIRAAARLCGVARRRADALQLSRGWSFQELASSLRVTASMGTHLHDTATAAARDMLGSSSSGDGGSQLPTAPQAAEDEAELAQRIALTSTALSAEAASTDAGNAYRAAAQRVGAALLCGGDDALAEACAELDGSALAARRARTVLVSLLAMQLAGTTPPEGALLGQTAGLVSTVMHAVTHPESARSRGGAAIVAAELADVVDDLSLLGGAASDKDLVDDCTDLSLILIGMEATSGALRGGGDLGEDVAGV